MVKKGNLEAAKAAAKKAVRKAAAKSNAATKAAAAKPAPKDAAAKPAPKAAAAKVKSEPSSPRATPTTVVSKSDISNFLSRRPLNTTAA